MGCDPPRSFAATWELGGSTTWIEVRLSAEHDGATRFELEDIAHVAEELWDQFGSGAVGIGWDLSVHGLANHLTTGRSLSPDQGVAWAASAEGRRGPRRIELRCSTPAAAVTRIPYVDLLGFEDRGACAGSEKPTRRRSAASSARDGQPAKGGKPGLQTGDANWLAGDSLAAERSTLTPDDSAPGTLPPAILVVRCECGFEVRGSADDVVAGIQSHARDNHNMQTTREQVLARARPA